MKSIQKLILFFMILGLVGFANCSKSSEETKEEKTEAKTEITTENALEEADKLIKELEDL